MSSPAVVPGAGKRDRIPRARVSCCAKDWLTLQQANRENNFPFMLFLSILLLTTSKGLFHWIQRKGSLHELLKAATVSPLTWHKRHATACSLTAGAKMAPFKTDVFLARPRERVLGQPVFVCLFDCLSWTQNRRSHSGDVPDSEGTLTFDLPKNKAKGLWS